MTHLAYAQQAPSSFKINVLTTIADAPILDEQAVAQAQLEQHITQQAQAVAPEELTVVEISFYDHEIYAGQKLIASITHDDDDFVTQRWVVMINNLEIHRADSWAKCHSHITWHYTQGTLPAQQQQVDSQAPTTTSNEVMAQIAAACDEFGFDLTNDGIYYNDVKLGQVGYTDGNWWVTHTSSQHQTKVPCDSAADAMWSLSMVETSSSADRKVRRRLRSVPEGTSADHKGISCEELLDKPFDQLTSKEWERLLEYKPLPKAMVLVTVQ